MAVAREKHRAHRNKVKEAATKKSVTLVQPTTVESPAKIKEKIKVSTKSRSALVSGEGRSMDMELD